MVFAETERGTSYTQGIRQPNVVADPKHACMLIPRRDFEWQKEKRFGCCKQGKRLCGGSAGSSRRKDVLQ
jgi:hypothetical protein